jgi:hypothetical protein
MRVFDQQQRAPQDLTSPTFKVPFYPYRRLLYRQHEQDSVILKLRAAELCYLREQLLINPRGGIRRMCFGECGDFFYSEFFALRPLGFGNTVGK